MDSLINDLRVGIRSLLRSPLITFPAVLSLALGIAATTTIFSVADVVLFQPLRFPEPDRLMAVWMTNPERGWPRNVFSVPNLLDYRDRSRSIDVAGYRTQGFNLSGSDEPDRLAAVVATSNIFEVSGFDPVVGRAFNREEKTEGRQFVALLGYDVWNECNYSPQVDHSDHTKNAFRAWLKEKYGDLESLSLAWHRYGHAGCHCGLRAESDTYLACRVYRGR